MLAIIWIQGLLSISVASQLTPAGDVICGPRCVAFVIESYRGEQPDSQIYILCHEIQPQRERGSSVASVRNSLLRHQVAAQCVSSSVDMLRSWPYPVIVYLSGETPDRLGHFVVTLGVDSGGQIKVWNGLAGIEHWGFDKFSDGPALVLTAPNDQTLQAELSRYDARSRRDHVIEAALCISLCVEILLILRVSLGKS